MLATLPQAASACASVGCNDGFWGGGNNVGIGGGGDVGFGGGSDLGFGGGGEERLDVRLGGCGGGEPARFGTNAADVALVTIAAGLDAADAALVTVAAGSGAGAGF